MLFLTTVIPRNLSRQKGRLSTKVTIPLHTVPIMYKSFSKHEKKLKNCDFWLFKIPPDTLTKLITLESTL